MQNDEEFKDQSGFFGCNQNRRGRQLRMSKDGTSWVCCNPIKNIYGVYASNNKILGISIHT